MSQHLLQVAPHKQKHSVLDGKVVNLNVLICSFFGQDFAPTDCFHGHKPCTFLFCAI